MKKTIKNTLAALTLGLVIANIAGISAQAAGVGETKTPCNATASGQKASTETAVTSGDAPKDAKSATGK